MFKKTIIAFLALALIGSFPLSAYAESAQANSSQQNLYTTADEIITNPLRYQNISIIQPSIKVTGSTAVCSINVSVKSQVAKTQIKLVLERSTNGGSSYSEYKTIINATYTGSYIIKEGSSSITSSDKYRVKALVTVYDSSGKVIETAPAAYAYA